MRTHEPDPTNDEDLVWYAAYGSNMAADRLRCYLEGGCPPGGRRAHTGARDRTPPRASRPLRLPLSLHFAGASAVWGGGKAFVTPGGGRQCLARAWLLHHQQFDDLASQESGRPTRRIAVDRVCRVRGLRLGDGHYDRILHCGELEGVPVVTFTHPERPAGRAPAPAYLRMLARGLRQAHDLTAREAATYLAGAEGVGRSAVEVHRLLHG